MFPMSVTAASAQPPDVLASSSLQRLAAVAVSISLCLLGGWAHYLLIVFSSLKRSRAQAWVDSGDAVRERKGKVLLSLFQIYYVLLTLLYSIQYLTMASVPIVLGYAWSAGSSFGIAAFLVITGVYLLPRLHLPPGDYEEKASRYEGLVRAVLCLNQTIPLNGFIKRLISSPRKDEGSLIISRQNIATLLSLHNPLHYGYRQEQLQLLQKLLRLRERKVTSLMVERRHIFTLDVQSSVTQKLLGKLGKFVFSKILVSEGGEDHVIGYMHFKKLLFFDREDETIADRRREVIEDNLALVSHTASLFQALNAMLEQRVDFALVYGEGRLVGLVKLKEIFSGMLLNWYNYEGLSAERSYEYLSTQCPRRKVLASVDPLLEGEQQS